MSSQPPLTRLEPLIFEKGAPGRRGLSFPPLDLPDRPLEALLPPAAIRKAPLALPEVSELEVVRHYTRLSRENYGVDVGFYPLGSCTMKYNPKVNEDVARLPGFALLHPLTPPEQAQGALGLIYELEQCLKAVGGVARCSLQPVAGAQGELVGLLIVRAYHEQRGRPRTIVVVPDTAHGTNPASATLAGLKTKVVRSSRAGLVDLDDLRRVVDRDTAALMLTNPNTLGLFERDILEISRIVHEAGGLMYMDGANLNALVGLCRPGEMGFDVVHFNLHKTFSTPHGGGGPGAGAVGVRADLAPFLPAPTVEKVGDRYVLDEARPRSIGRVHPFYGNFGILVRAYAYLRRLGAEGLRGVSRGAILNANYVRKRLEGAYAIPYNRACMHEFVLSCKRFTPNGVHAWDVAKRLIDYGIYSPTVNFPLLVEECLMIEAPETESLETLDEFCEAMLAIAREAEQTPAVVKTAPHASIARRPGRLDEVKAARRPILRWSRERP